MNYYKIINQEGHNGLIYHKDRNIDPLPFNPNGDYEPGGIYFAKEDILVFIDYGTELYEVEPIGEIYENPGKPKKYKAHEINLKYIGKVIDNIEMLINEGANVHANDDYALRWAARNGYYKIVKLLLKYGANVHANDDYALRWAAYNGYYNIVKLLLRHGANIHTNDDYALRWAANNGHYDVVKLLLKNGADIHARDDYALRWAAGNWHYEIVKLLIEHSANIHANNDEALHWARYNDDKRMIRLLESYY